MVDDRYRIEHTLGEGSMGVVVAATDRQLGRAVALKFLRPKGAGLSDTLPRFVREARAAAAMQGEHIARVLDIGSLPSGIPYLVFEHLVGCDLKQLLLQQGPLAIDEAVEYVAQACAGMAEAHALGVIHRDLKPSNLFLTKRSDGTPLIKVLDFGISKITTSIDPGITSSGIAVGSPQYMSPEQIERPSQVDRRSDIWSLGIILHELVTGLAPFHAESTTGLLVTISARPPIPLRKHHPNAPASLEAIVLRCLEKDPARRFDDARALARALRGVIGAGDVRPELTATADPPSAPVTWVGGPPSGQAFDDGAASGARRWRRRPVAALAIAAFAAFALIVGARGRHAPTAAATPAAGPGAPPLGATAAMTVAPAPAPQPRPSSLDDAPQSSTSAVVSTTVATPPVARPSSAPTTARAPAKPKRGALDPLADRK